MTLLRHHTFTSLELYPLEEVWMKMLMFEHSVEKPLNREPAVKDLISSFITREGAYNRNHGPTLHIDHATHGVVVNGAVDTTLNLSMEDLQNLPQHQVTCALQCAGNRRHTMRTLLKEVDGIDWGDGAVMNCLWQGPRVRDILIKAGLKVEKGHVAFACHQEQCQDDDWYGGSIELWRAMAADREVILALKMNGSVLPSNHGGPVRVVVPGVAGARSVKWLDMITVQDAESRNFYQRHDYKILPPVVTNTEQAEKYWDVVPALQDMPVNSVIGLPQSGDTIKTGQDQTVEVKGYALPHGPDGPVVKVEVSVDDGVSWAEAELLGDPDSDGRWSWILWQARVKLQAGKRRKILSRATDHGGSTQVRNPGWNLRGVAYNGYGEVRDLNVEID